MEGNGVIRADELLALLLWQAGGSLELREDTIIEANLAGRYLAIEKDTEHQRFFIRLLKEEEVEIID